MKSTVLFLCTGNSARSQMAEGYLRHVAGERLEVLSAGISPKGIHPVAIQVMKEVGIDIGGQRSKDVQEFGGVPIQVVITVCSRAKEQCPIFPAAVKRIHWDLEDPAAALGTDEEKLTAFRIVRDKLFAHVNSFFVRSAQELRESAIENAI
jgi:arsenate reductase